MSREQKEQVYFRMLKDRWDRTDKSSRKEIQEYNEWKRQLRKAMLDD